MENIGIKKYKSQNKKKIIAFYQKMPTVLQVTKKKKTDQNSLFYRQTWEISWLRFTESLRVVRKHSQKGDYFL